MRSGVCEVHGLGGAPHCALCAKELRDELDLLRFSAAVHEPAPPDGPLALRWERGFFGLAQRLDSLLLRFSERRVRRAFEKRSLDQIAQWRRGAGIRLRG